MCHKLLLVTCLPLLFSVSSVLAIDNSSIYAQLASDTQITAIDPAEQVLIQKTLTLTSSAKVLVQSDGAYYIPLHHYGSGGIHVKVDGAVVTNDCVCDYSYFGSTYHCFNCIGSLTLAPGSHNVQLVAKMYRNISYQATSFYVMNTANLSILVNPATTVQQSTIQYSSGVINVTTLGIYPPTPLPTVSVLSNQISTTTGPVISLASCSAVEVAGGGGDAMIGIYLNNQCPSISMTSWSVNDLTDVEMTAPMSCQALHSVTGTNMVSLMASELPWTEQHAEDPVHYFLAGGGTLITLYGGFSVAGAVNPAPWSEPNCNPNNYRQVYPNNGPYTMWETNFTIPSNHNGNIMIASKVRVLDGTNRGTGDVYLDLYLDGVHVGSQGHQFLASGYSISQRTLTASFYAQHLSAGAHNIKGVLRASGLPDLGASNDLGLLFFD